MGSSRAIRRRDVTLFLAGLLVGCLLVSLLFSLGLNRASLQRGVYKLLPARYAAYTCSEAAPHIANGAQIWMHNPRPAPETTTTICARLVIDGKVVRSAVLQGTIRYSTNRGTSHEAALGTSMADQDGIIQMVLEVGDARFDFPVEIDVQLGVDGDGPFSYQGYTSYTPSNDYLSYPPP